MLTDEQIGNLFTNGFLQLKLPEVANHNYDDYEFCIAFDEGEEYLHTSDPKFDPIFEEFGKLIEERYISDLDKEFYRISCQMVQGVNLRAREWHTDVVLEYNMNITILIYLDDTTEFKNGIDIRNGIEEWNILPKSGDVIMLLVNPKFQHKATYNSGIRRAVLYDYYVPALGTQK